MVIKPLEKNDGGLILKIFLILILAITGFFINQVYLRKKKQIIKNEISQKKEVLGESIIKNIDKGLKKVEEVTGDVLGEVTTLVTNSASKSAEVVTDFVFENTVGNLVKQIDKLPQRQQEEIREKICK